MVADVGPVAEAARRAVDHQVHDRPEHREDDHDEQPGDHGGRGQNLSALDDVCDRRDPDDQDADRENPPEKRHECSFRRGSVECSRSPAPGQAAA